MTHPFTPTYIAMAKAAEEIQAMRDSFDDGDWLEVAHPEYGASVDVKRDYNPFVEPPEVAAWLPRLDQLLGMLGDTPYAFSFRWARSDNFNATAKEIQIGCMLENFSDWHELALAVVMREKHGKTWDGKGWVKV